MPDGFALIYLIGTMLTGMVLFRQMGRMPEEERRKLKPAYGVVLILIWPIFWILVIALSRKMRP